MKLVEAEAELSKFRDFIAKKTPSDAGKKMFEAIQTMLGETKRLKAAPPPDERVAEKHDTPTFCPFCGTKWIRCYSVEEDQCSSCGSLVGMLFSSPADERVAELEQVGWWNPASKSFCYLDVKESRAGRYAGYSVPVFCNGKVTLAAGKGGE